MKRQRFYKLEKPIRKNADGKDVIKDLIELIDWRVKPEYREHVKKQFQNGIEYVCISDAFTHIERLTFPAFYFKKEMKYISLNICGRNTFMTAGGDSSAVYDDEVYLRKLRIANR